MLILCLSSWVKYKRMLQKQSVDISFQRGLDLKTDPKRVAIGKFLDLQNSIFTKAGLLQKRNGFPSLTTLPVTDTTYLTTFNDDLTAIGTNIYAYNIPNQTWIDKATLFPCELSTLTLIRNNTNQSQCDAVISSNGLVCTVYTDQNLTSLTTFVYRFVVADSTTGQNIIEPTTLVNADPTYGTPRVFLLSSGYFVIVYTQNVAGNYHLQYITISTNNPETISSPKDIATGYGPSHSLAFDGYTLGEKLYIAYNELSGGQSVKVTYIQNVAQGPVTPITFAGYDGEVFTLTADITTPQNPIIYISFVSRDTTNTYVAVIDQNLNVLLPPLSIQAAIYPNLASTSIDGSLSLYLENQNDYPDATTPTNFISLLNVSITPSFQAYFLSGSMTITVTSTNGLIAGQVITDLTTPGNITAGTTITFISGLTVTLSSPTAGNSAASPGDVMRAANVSTPVVIKRSVGLASKAFLLNGIGYMLVAYSSVYQPSFFLMDQSGDIIAKLAYSNAGSLATNTSSNGGGYLSFGLPNVTLTGNLVQIAYLIKDSITAVNKNNGALNDTAGIYAQSGINLASFTIGTSNVSASEAAETLNLSGGFVWTYDGYLAVEQNFFVWPDYVTATWSTTGGTMAAQPDGMTNTNAYYYQVIYVWADNQGNRNVSAPSIPVAVTTTGSGSTGSVSLTIDTLRLTYKVVNPVKLEIYRWSVANQVYYQVTSIQLPLLNSTTVDYVTFVDTLPDADIIGNEILYTTGGVVEDISPPATNILTLFQTRMWLVDAEDPNLLWFSKQIIETTPIEFSDLFTLYVSPTIGAQGSTGPITALFPMDDKLIIFKQSNTGTAIYYVNGSGPDNTGANNQFSEPIFVSSTIGCNNQQSLVLIPTGLIFQSDKGLWLLGRDLSTTYIGARVETLTQGALVNTALTVPGTTQVRFTMNTGVTLMYDYFFDEWGTFTGIPGISSTLFQGMHTYVNSLGQVFQESPGTYLDATNPVLMSFTTSWISLAGLQGFERFYQCFLLGSYLTPFQLNVQFAYDYNPSITQSQIVTPQNYQPNWGGDALWGSNIEWGGISQVFAERVFPEKEKCETFSLTVNEIYDASYGVPAGAGLTLSGLNLMVGIKRAFRTQSAGKSS